MQFATERRRGWEEEPGSPERDPLDTWDVRRKARLRNRQPNGDLVLMIESVGQAFGEFARQAVDGMYVLYSLESEGEIEVLDVLQWADWDTDGRLLVATRGAALQLRRLDAGRREVLFEEDLSALVPAPRPSPVWAMSR